jgi:hypothetical protein
MWSTFALPSFSLGAKILMGLGILATVAATSAKFTHDVVSTKYQNILLKQEVAVRTIEKEVAVLDTVTLAKAITAEKKRWEREQKQKETLNEVIRNHENSASPWCQLSPYELCLWNSENGDGLDNTCSVSGSREKLPVRSTEGTEREYRTTVAK